MISILMVCSANVCRSPMAQIVGTQKAERGGVSQQIRFESAGIHASRNSMRMDTRAVAVLERRGYSVKKMRSRSIEEKDFQRFDLILAMDLTIYGELQRICPLESQFKLKMFLTLSPDLNREATSDEVPDPYYGNFEGFERVLDLCEAGVEKILSRTFG